MLDEKSIQQIYDKYSFQSNINFDEFKLGQQSQLPKQNNNYNHKTNYENGNVKQVNIFLKSKKEKDYFNNKIYLYEEKLLNPQKLKPKQLPPLSKQTISSTSKPSSFIDNNKLNKILENENKIHNNEIRVSEMKKRNHQLQKIKQLEEMQKIELQKQHEILRQRELQKIKQRELQLRKQHEILLKKREHELQQFRKQRELQLKNKYNINFKKNKNKVMRKRSFSSKTQSQSKINIKSNKLYFSENKRRQIKKVETINSKKTNKFYKLIENVNKNIYDKNIPKQLQKDLCKLSKNITIKFKN